MERKKWWRYWLGGSVVIVAIVAVVAIMLVRRQPHPPKSIVAPRVAARTERSPTTPAAAAPTAASVTAPSKPNDGPEICGFGNAPSEIPDEASLGSYITDLTSKTAERWHAALLDSSDPRARAVELLIRGFTLRTTEEDADEEDVTTAAEETRSELVQLAVGGGDPAVYVAATWLCGNGMGDAATDASCQRISLAEWSRIDPDNIMPWLALARDARRRGDQAGEAAAFAHAAHAHRSDLYEDAMLQATLAHIPPDAKPLEKAVFEINLIEYQGAMPTMEVAEPLRYCSRETLQQDEKRRQCNAVAEVLVNEGKTLRDLSVGSKLGDLLGWPPQRVAQLKQELETLEYRSSPDPNPWSCLSVTVTNKLIEGRAQSGELPFLRAARGRALEDH